MTPPGEPYDPGASARRDAARFARRLILMADAPPAYRETIGHLIARLQLGGLTAKEEAGILDEIARNLDDLMDLSWADPPPRLTPLDALP